MCTILFSWKKTPGYKLILAANRDEFYARDTKTAHWWEDEPNILAGRDLQAGGTWMGLNKNGRFAAVTNFRKLPLEGPFNSSRGDLVKNFLSGDVTPGAYLSYLESNGNNYEGYNLIFGHGDELFYHSNKWEGFELDSSIYGLSNHLLDTPWPKVEKGKENFDLILNSPGTEIDALFQMLKDEEKAPDQLLPNTGLDIERERLVSSIFIKSAEYGTRLSTVITIDDNYNVEFQERAFIPKGESYFRFKIE